MRSQLRPSVGQRWRHTEHERAHARKHACIPTRQENSRTQDELLLHKFREVVDLEASCRKLQQRAVDRKWLAPFATMDDDEEDKEEEEETTDVDSDVDGSSDMSGGGGRGGGSRSGGRGSDESKHARRRRRRRQRGSFRTKRSASPASLLNAAFPYTVRQSIPTVTGTGTAAVATASQDATAFPMNGDTASDVVDATSLSYLFDIYRGAAVRGLAITVLCCVMCGGVAIVESSSARVRARACHYSTKKIHSKRTSVRRLWKCVRVIRSLWR